MSREEAIAATFKPAADEEVLLAELEEELRQTLSVEPSPDFARKVRTRIREGRLERDWQVWRWAAAAACLLALVMGWRITTRTPEMSSADSARARTGTDVQLAAVRAPGQLTEKAIATRREPVGVASRKRDVAEPEIIVPEDNARALAHLLTLARTGSITEERLTPVVAAASPTTLDVAPLDVPVIPTPEIEIQDGPPFGDGREQGQRQ
jgi:hypothetical protein